MKSLTINRKWLLIWLLISISSAEALPISDSLQIIWSNDSIPETSRIVQIHEAYERFISLHGTDNTLRITRQLTQKVRWQTDLRLYIIALEIHGLSYQYANNHEQAINYFMRSLNKADEIGFTEYRVINSMNLGKSYVDIGDYFEAVKYFSKVIHVWSVLDSTLTEGYKQDRQAVDLLTEKRILDLQREASFSLYNAASKLDNRNVGLDLLQSGGSPQAGSQSSETENRIQQIEYAEQRLADSLAMVDNRLIAEFNYQKAIQKEKNSRNLFMFIGIGILLISGGLYSRVRYIRRTNKELEEKNKAIAAEKEKTEESERYKDQFFANISHEFRTPLTLILGPLRQLSHQIDQSKLREELAMVERNAFRLQTMVNQLLSLNKVDSGKMKLEVREENIVKLAKELAESFTSLAEQKGVKLEIVCSVESYLIFFDRYKIETVVNNLLSNAFKFVSQDGIVSLKLESFFEKISAKEGVKVSVSNTGKVIPPEWKDHIFDRFSQVDGYNQIGFEGTGIGLALSKEFVEMHHGDIWVEPEYDQGASFSFFLPIGHSHFLNDMIVPQEENKMEIDSANRIHFASDIISEKESSIESRDEAITGTDLPILLIVEDNRDMVTYIKGFFDDQYHVATATNGAEGLAKAIELIPDLIISDLMMPEMDGHKLCEKIKQDERTSHIPVILLTAKATMDCKIESLETGADDFLVKPFNSDELQIRARNLIEQRRQLKQILKQHLEDHHQIKVLSISGQGITSMDEDFLNRAISIVDEHLSNPDFNVHEFSKYMNMHRVQLHRKLKALTGQSASDMIRSIRLKKAAELFRKNAGHVTQIAYDVGFSNLSYFAKAFKAEYNLSPSDYMRKHS